MQLQTPPPEIDRMAARAVGAGAVPPLEIAGEGATAVVFCDAVGVAFKVGRHPDDRYLREEADWLWTAQHVPWVKDHVARLFGYDAERDVIVRECVQARTSPRKHGARGVGEREAWDFMRDVDKHMLPYGWSAPESKPDSVVPTRDRGLVIVDAGFAHRVGFNLLTYVADVLAGRRRRGYSDNNESLAFYIRIEMDKGTIPRAIGMSMLRKLR